MTDSARQADRLYRVRKRFAGAGYPMLMSSCIGAAYIGLVAGLGTNLETITVMVATVAVTAGVGWWLDGAY